MTLAVCHPQRKLQARGLCKPCYDKWLKEVNPKYKEAQAANTTKWLRINPEKRAAISKRRQEKEKTDPVARRNRRTAALKRKYGITADDYDMMLLDQKGGCALCFRAPSPGKHLHVDHIHGTNLVRGLLCHQCNWYMGTIDADPQIYLRIGAYLTKKETA